jgi:hypothetical protein
MRRRRILKYAAAGAVLAAISALPGYELFRRWQITTETIKMEGKYVYLMGPPPYANTNTLDKLDRAYELLWDLTSIQPYGGEKVGLVLDSVDSSEYCGLAGDPIIIPRSCWQEGRFPVETIAYHELAHDFMGIPEFDRVLFVTDHFVEGFAQLGRQYVQYHFDMPRYEDDRSLYLSALKEYVENNYPFEMKFFGADVSAGVLMDLTDRYGFEMWKRFFRSIYRLDIGPKEDRTLEQRCSAFVRCVSETVGEDLTDYFRQLRFPL